MRSPASTLAARSTASSLAARSTARAPHPGERGRPRPVTVVDAGARPNIDVRIEVPIDDMSDLGTIDETVIASGNAAQGPQRKSICRASIRASSSSCVHIARR